jgi:AraC-like DNA-binding protein
MLSAEPYVRQLTLAEAIRPRQTMVEHRIAFGSAKAEFSVYDTAASARRVPLSASNPLFCGMVTGKKVIHSAEGAVIPFLPSESLVVPSGQTIHIDFPEATSATPTTCLTVEIDREEVRRTVARLNEVAPRSEDSGAWVYDDASVCHFANPEGIELTVQKLTTLFTEDHPDREVLIGLGVQELIVRMLRMEARRVLLEGSEKEASVHRLAQAAEYAKRHLHRAITVADLARAACMSEPAFFRAFRAEFGQTPLAYVTDLRMKRACQLLRSTRSRVASVAEAVGFSSTSHFIRLFRRYTGQTPKQYQLANRNNAIPALAVA